MKKPCKPKPKIRSRKEIEAVLKALDMVPEKHHIGAAAVIKRTLRWVLNLDDEQERKKNDE